jgi:hypothetical protein
VKLPAAVEGIEAFQHLSEDVGDDVLWYFADVVIDEVHHGSSVHELYEHEQGLLIVVGEEVAGEIAGVA